MRYLIISDLHGNFEALEAAVAAADRKYDRVICCGDLVGYGPDPNETVNWVRENAMVVVRGNHDKACCGIDDAGEFNPIARKAAFWTREELTPENLAYLRELPMGPIPMDGFQVAHGSVQDEDEYIFVAQDASLSFPQLERPLTFFGHTHLQGGFVRLGDGPVRTIQLALPKGLVSRPLELHEREQYLLNPGSIGQPRDGDPRAAFSIFDSEPPPGFVEFWRVPYDIAKTQAKMMEAGLPPPLAFRLGLGR